MKKSDSRETKRKMSKQTILTIGMIMVSIFVITIASYAWYLISNTPKIKNAEFVADTLGNLQIANENDDHTGPDTYMDAINMYEGRTKTDYKLSPITTLDGKVFYKPMYMEGKISELKAFTEQDTDLTTNYIYEKVFYLRAGDDSVTATGKEKYYDIKLVGMSTNEKNRYLENSGNYKTDYELDPNSQNGYIGTFMNDNNATVSGTAAYALRVSFTFKDAYGEEKVVIYEPNCDKNNDSSQDNYLAYTNKENESFGTYTVTKILKQSATKSFAYTGTTGTDVASETFATIKEGADVKVTMRVWIEGTDVDCRNSIAADKIFGQIQFISEENKTYPPQQNP